MSFLFNFLIKKKGIYSRKGVVPDKETAIKIAEAVWIPMFGEEYVYFRKPYKFYYIPILRYWIISGTLPPNLFGGVQQIVIKKGNGKILFIYYNA